MPSRRTRHRLGGGQALVRQGRRQLDRPRANLTYLNVCAASRGSFGNKGEEKNHERRQS